MSVAINHEKLNRRIRASLWDPYEASSISGRRFRDIGATCRAEGPRGRGGKRRRYQPLGASLEYGGKWEHLDCGKRFYDFGARAPKCPSCAKARKM